MGTPLAKQCMKALKEVGGKSCIISKAAGAKNASESQRAKALQVMKAAKDREEEDFYDPARKDNLLGINQTRQGLWKEHFKDPIEALDKALFYIMYNIK